MATSEAAKASKHADKFKGYVAKPEVKACYDLMKHSAKAIDIVEGLAKFVEKPGVMDALTKKVPALAARIGNIAGLAKALGPAGVALGVGVDLMVAVGLLEDATMKKLDEISRQIKELSEDVKKGFESIKMHLKIERALKRFLEIHDKLQAKVVLYEETVIQEGTINADIFYELLQDMVKDCPPLEIITDLKQMHLLITGEASFCDGKPLFDQLAEEGNGLEGEAVDQFISSLLLQFQTTVALEMRAFRMLRSFIAYEETDVKYSQRLKAIFENLADQRTKHDPVQTYGWYLDFRAIGGTFLMNTVKWPDYYVYMTSWTSNIRGSQGNHEGDQGVFIITPCNDGTFLISPKEWPQHYVSMPEKTMMHIINPVGLSVGRSSSPAAQPGLPMPTPGDVAKQFVPLLRFVHNPLVTNLAVRVGGLDVTGDDVRRDRWKFIIKDVSKRKFLLEDAQLQGFYMYMRGDLIGSVKCDKGDPDDRCNFILTPQPDPHTERYLKFRAFGGTFVMTTVKHPNWYMTVDGDGNVRGSKSSQQAFIIEPYDGGTFLIQTKALPNQYLYMEDNSSGDIKGSCTSQKPGPQGHWCIECNDIGNHTFLLSTAKWPKWYMYMEADSIANVRGNSGDPGKIGHFKLNICQ